MGRPRKPLDRAKTEGRDVIQPGRYAERSELGEDLGPLGEPPEWIVDGPDCHMQSAWELFQKEAPWLKASHRMLVGMASQLQGCMMAGTPLEVKEMTLLKSLLSSMGMTPSDAGKVMMPEAPKEPKRGDITAPLKRR